MTTDVQQGAFWVGMSSLLPLWDGPPSSKAAASCAHSKRFALCERALSHTSAYLWRDALSLVRMGRRGLMGQSWGTAWRVIFQASPVTSPSARAVNRVLLSKGLEINDLCSSLREMVAASWAEGGRITMGS